MPNDISTCDQRCPVEVCFEVIGGKWKGVIVYHLLSGTRRFNDLRRLVPGVTQRMLTRQLREMEADGIVERTVYPEVPPRVEYCLTALGRTLEPIILTLRAWGIDFLTQVRSPDATGSEEPMTRAARAGSRGLRVA